VIPAPAVQIASPASPVGDSLHFEYIEHFLEDAYARSLLEKFHLELSWRQEEIRLFGRAVLQPRLSCWYGDMGADYSYSGLQLQPLPWHPQLLELQQRLQYRLGVPFNSVLANAYRDGRDSMGWHSDDEKELGAEPVIASISLGAGRRFLVRSKKGSAVASLQLEHGSLLVMRGRSQKDYRHSVPKTTRPVGLRINLTFRQVQP